MNIKKGCRVRENEKKQNNSRGPGVNTVELDQQGAVNAG